MKETEVANGRTRALREAEQYVTVDRNQTHGDPEDNLGTIAELWRVYLAGREVASLTALDVAAMMGLLKISRLRTSPLGRDNWIDLIGYGACGADIAERWKE